MNEGMSFTTGASVVQSETVYQAYLTNMSWTVARCVNLRLNVVIAKKYSRGGYFFCWLVTLARAEFFDRFVMEINSNPIAMQLRHTTR